jgi:endonuclease YncB( thermonuclease family)
MMRVLALAVLCWSISAYNVRVVDGDTAIMAGAVWPDLTATMHVRVLGVDTPELRGATLEDGRKAKAFTEAWLGVGPVRLTIACTGHPAHDSFGRVLAVVTRDGKNLADELIAAKLGVPMAGR